MAFITEKGEIKRRKKLYGDAWDKVVNDEPSLPSLPKDFAERVEKVLKARSDRDSLLVKRLGIYGADLATRVLADNPHFTVEQVIEMVEL